MSSTSTDICELWNGNGISRVQGFPQPAPIIEIYHAERDDAAEVNTQTKPEDQQGLLGDSKSHNFKIYGFKSGNEEGLLTPEKQSNKGGSTFTASDDLASDVAPPNLGFNISPQRASMLELQVVAVIGTLLQFAVIAFAGVSVLSPWKEHFQKTISQLIFTHSRQWHLVP